MALADYVSVAISATGPGPSAPGFGIGIAAAYHNVGGSKRVMGPYTSAAGVAADFSNTAIGGDANYYKKAPYLMAEAYFEQSPQPQLLYIGRRALPFTQKLKITPVSTANGTTYNINFGATSAVGGTLMSYTVTGSPSLATLCTALATAIGTAIGSGTADGSSGTHIEWTSGTPGTLIECNVQVPASICRVTEDTVDPGVTTDLTAIWAENKAWYGLTLDSASAQETEASAVWVEANGSVIFAATTSDTDAGDATVTNDVLSTLKSTSVTRTAGLFTQYSNMSFGAVAWLAVHLTQTPGSDTWNFNTLAGIQADTDYLCPESVIVAVKAKNGTVYTTLANLNLTQGGTSGGGEWMDQTRFVDWLRVTIQLAMIALLARNQGKVPYDDTGIAQLEQELRTVLQQGVTNGGFVAGSVVITPPSVASIPLASVQARNLPAIPFSAQFAGAIHSLGIKGTTSVA